MEGCNPGTFYREWKKSLKPQYRIHEIYGRLLVYCVDSRHIAAHRATTSSSRATLKFRLFLASPPPSYVLIFRNLGKFHEAESSQAKVTRTPTPLPPCRPCTESKKKKHSCSLRLGKCESHSVKEFCNLWQPGAQYRAPRRPPLI